ncbi:MAG: hypothetical protein E7561_02210 [Ruminococcaceae bacterium]|nr:hypothetical protein [Oscillospiraceae bacterium]
MRNAVKISVILSFLSVFLIAIIIITVSTSKTDKPIVDDGYYMKSLNNTVALYKDEDIIKIYDGIVVDTLPITDRQLLERGIHYKSIADADSAAEDYDG